MYEGDLCVQISRTKGMPSLSTVGRWREAHPAFREAYARARVIQAQACAEIAVLEGMKATSEDAAAARVRFDAGRWIAARIDPANYSERVQTQHLDKNGDPTDLRVEVVLKG